MPVYGVFESGSTNGIPDVENGDLVAIMFMDAPLYPEQVTDEELLKLVYDDGLAYVDHWNAMWDQLLDQMTFEEQCYIVVNSYHWIHGAVSIALPESRQENGPVGITKRTELFFSLPNDDTIKGDDGTGWTWLAYPCAGILAASFDTDIAQRVGEHKSEDMLYLGYNGIYGPGVNMHRSPFGGRAFEYPSEDPYLAGYTAAYETIGIESKGAMAYVKHYALNDMETNRVNCGIWSTEQASREIYLRAFEIVFTVGKASATMNSFTRIGTTWNGASYEMMTAILRDEWGYDGLVISDWVTDGSAMSYVDGVMAGTDTFDGNGLATELTKYSNNAAVAQAVTTALLTPFAPTSIEILPAHMSQINIGIVNGEHFVGPLLSIAS
jgi:beta-glucosidase